MQKTAPLYDEGNRLLEETRSELTTGQIATPHGNRLVITVRTTTATVTAVVGPEEAALWAKAIQAAADKFSDTIMAPEPQRSVLKVGR
jgi:hypothetical protein